MKQPQDVESWSTPNAGSLHQCSSFTPSDECRFEKTPHRHLLEDLVQLLFDTCHFTFVSAFFDAPTSNGASLGFQPSAPTPCSSLFRSQLSIRMRASWNNEHLIPRTYQHFFVTTLVHGTVEEKNLSGLHTLKLAAVSVAYGMNHSSKSGEISGRRGRSGDHVYLRLPRQSHRDLDVTLVILRGTGSAQQVHRKWAPAPATGGLQCDRHEFWMSCMCTQSQKRDQTVEGSRARKRQHGSRCRLSRLLLIRCSRVCVWSTVCCNRKT